MPNRPTLAVLAASVIAAMLLVASACDRTIGASCITLQDYYDSCCTACGEQDSYCSYDPLYDGEESCAEEMKLWTDLDICLCDEE
jgi:hypothetical protein